MRTRRLTLIVTGLGIAGAVLIAALLLSIPYLLDLPRIQALLRAEASRLVDRPVRFERVSLGFWPLPAVRVRGLLLFASPPEFDALSTTGAAEGAGAAGRARVSRLC